MAVYTEMANTKRVDIASKIPLPAPFVIQLEPSGFCNLKCSFCPVNDEKAQKYLFKSMMSNELFQKFLDQCTEFPVKIKVLRFIGNGEPTLNSNISDFVLRAKESGAFEKVEITTNGTLLSRELSKALIDAGLDTLKVSLEAVSTDKFFEIAKVKVDIDELYDKIAFFYSKRKKCKVYIKTTDIALNEQERKLFAEKWGRICDYYFVENISNIWPEYTTENNVKRYGDKDIMKPVEHPICIQPFDLLSICADGEVLPCCADWKRLLSLGNINKTNIAAIWQGEKMREIRLSLLSKREKLPCKECGFPGASQRDFIDDNAACILKKLQ